MERLEKGKLIRGRFGEGRRQLKAPLTFTLTVAELLRLVFAEADDCGIVDQSAIEAVRGGAGGMRLAGAPGPAEPVLRRRGEMSVALATLHLPGEPGGADQGRITVWHVVELQVNGILLAGQYYVDNLRQAEEAFSRCALLLGIGTRRGLVVDD